MLVGLNLSTTKINNNNVGFGFWFRVLFLFLRQGVTQLRPTWTHHCEAKMTLNFQSSCLYLLNTVPVLGRAWCQTQGYVHTSSKVGSLTELFSLQPKVIKKKRETKRKPWSRKRIFSKTSKRKIILQVMEAQTLKASLVYILCSKIVRTTQRPCL